jgi:hypothetical protein
MQAGPGMKMLRSRFWMNPGGMVRWRTGWPSGISPRRIVPRWVMALPNPFLGGDNVRILVTRTQLFSLFFLTCSLFVCSFLCFLLYRCTSSPVTPSASITLCFPPLSCLSDTPVFSFAHYVHFFRSHWIPSPASMFCTPFLPPFVLLCSRSL